jgi:hypothetical protein
MQQQRQTEYMSKPSWRKSFEKNESMEKAAKELELHLTAKL